MSFNAYPKCSAIAAELVSRLRTILEVPTGRYIRLCISPNPDGSALFKAQEGVSLIVGPMQNQVDSGAGRRGMKVSRNVTAVCMTACNLDPSGSDEVAIKKHLDLEERVIDALIDRNPLNIASQAGIVFNFTGGADSSRFVERGPAFIDSALQFELVYPLRLQVS